MGTHLWKSEEKKNLNSNLNPIKIGMDYEYSQVQVLWVCLVQRRRREGRNFNREEKFD